MVDPFDNVVIEASVLDDFSDTLDELKQDLAGVRSASEAADPIEIDERLGDTMAQLAGLRAMLNDIDRKDIDIETNIDWDVADDERLWQLMGMQTGQGISDVDNPYRAESQTLFRAGERADFDADVPGMRELIWGRSGPRAQPLRDAKTGGFSNLITHRSGPSSLFERVKNFVGTERNDGMGSIVDDFKELRVTMGALMNIFAAFIPLLAAFVGALPAVIAGVSALAVAALAAAGALYGLAGLAALGLATSGGEFNFEQLRSKIQGSIDEFLAAFTPLANSFVPLANDAFELLNATMFEVAASAEYLSLLLDDARWIMQGMAEVLPSLTRDIILFGQAAMPIFRELVGDIGAINVFDILATLIIRTIKQVAIMTNELVKMLPAIFNVSKGFLSVVTVVTRMIGLFFKMINAFPIVSENLGALTAMILVAATATSLWNIVTGGVIGRLLTLAGDAIVTAIMGLHSYIATQYTAAAATWATVAAVGALVGLLTFGLAPLMSGLSMALTPDAGINNAKEELKNFRDRDARISSSMGRSSSGQWSGPRYSRPATNVIAPDKETGNAVANTIGFQQRRDSITTDKSDVDNRRHSK